MSDNDSAVVNRALEHITNVGEVLASIPEQSAPDPIYLARRLRVEISILQDIVSLLEEKR